MSFQKEFDKAYKAKSMKILKKFYLFLDVWDEKADLEHIPYYPFYYRKNPFLC